MKMKQRVRQKNWDRFIIYPLHKRFNQKRKRNIKMEKRVSELTIDQKYEIIKKLKEMNAGNVDYICETYKEYYKEIDEVDKENFIGHIKMIYEVFNASFEISLQRKFVFQKHIAIVLCMILDQVENILNRIYSTSCPFDEHLKKGKYLEKFKDLYHKVDSHECAKLYDLLVEKYGEGIIEKMKSEYTEPVNPLAQIMNQIFKFKSSEDKPEKVDSKDYLKQKLEELGISAEEFEKEKEKFR